MCTKWKRSIHSLVVKGEQRLVARMARVAALSTSLRNDVLRLYRRILKVSRTWEAQIQQDTAVERAYIRDEARTLFKKNIKVVDEAEIKVCIEEANSRLEMALHYKNPYPRPVNVPPNFVMSSKDKKGVVRRSKQSKPVYIHTNKD